MVKRVQRIDSLPDDAAWLGGVPPEDAAQPDSVARGIDALLRVQRPAVLAHLRSIRLRNPEATPAQFVRILERRYLLAVTSGGAAVGATAVVPGIGTGVTLALSGAETAGFLESTALFAQSVAEVHGIAVTDSDRSRVLVMTLMLGKEGTELLAQFAGQAAGKSLGRGAFWGEMITKTLPRAAFGPLVDRVKKAFIAQFTARAGASVIGKAMPFGVGAVIGAGGNHLLGRRVVNASRAAFGPPPTELPAEITPRVGAKRIEHHVRDAARLASNSATRGVRRAAKAVTDTTKRVTRRDNRR